MNRRSFLAASLLFAAAAGAPACTAGKVALHARTTTLPTGIHVRLREGFIEGPRVRLELWLENATDADIQVDLTGMTLRLPDGTVVPPFESKKAGPESRTLVAAQGTNAFVEFRADHDLSGLPGATLVLGGITFGKDPAPRVAGELPLSLTPAKDGDAPPAGGGAKSAAPAATSAPSAAPTASGAPAAGAPASGASPAAPK
jgi:hypothetical protein